MSYASRTMTETEQRYAQIEKEALAVTWACQKFDLFLVGRTFLIETDHKPLVPLLVNKDLSELPIRIQRFRMRLMKYDYKISNSPGSRMFIADFLSRVSYPEYRDIERESKVERHSCCVVENTPLIDHESDRIKRATNSNPILKEVIAYSQSFWSDKSTLTPTSAIYYNFRDELMYYGGILIKGSRILIPESIRKGTIRKIHEGHQ